MAKLSEESLNKLTKPELINSIFNESPKEKRINSTWSEGLGKRIKRVHEKTGGRTGPIQEH